MSTQFSSCETADSCHIFRMHGTACSSLSTDAHLCYLHRQCEEVANIKQHLRCLQSTHQHYKGWDTYVRVCVIGFGVWTVSVSVRFVCYGPERRCCRVWASSRPPGGCPGSSVSVVCALRGSLSGRRWVPCPCVCVWCLGGTGCGVM